MEKNEVTKSMPQTFIKLYKVNAGDCIQVHYEGEDKKYHNIVIDCGYSGTFTNTLDKEIHSLKERNELIDLFILTHTDQDHIGGMNKFIKLYGDKNIVNQYWFNGGRFLINIPNTNKISTGQGFELDEYIISTGRGNSEKIIFGNDDYNFKGAKIRLLGPFEDILTDFLKRWKNYDYTNIMSNKITTKECDWGIPIEDINLNNYESDDRDDNRVSITFILEICNKVILFLGDSFAEDVEKALRLLGYCEKKRLVVDYVKVSHHGSKGNTSDGLLNLVKCENFIISANGANRDHFPHKEIFARILRHNLREKNEKIKFIFNYDTPEIKSIFTEDELEKYNFECIYPKKGENNVTIFL